MTIKSSLQRQSKAWRHKKQQFGSSKGEFLLGRPEFKDWSLNASEGFASEHDNLLPIATEVRLSGALWASRYRKIRYRRILSLPAESVLALPREVG